MFDAPRLPGKIGIFSGRVVSWDCALITSGESDDLRQLLDDKIQTIRFRFATLIGKTIVRYETAELLLIDGTWTAWPDLPVRLHTNDAQLVAVSWSKFDELWLANDLSLPFSLGESTIRWTSDSTNALNAAIGKTVRSVFLGRGAMTMGDRDIEIWTRLLVRLDAGWLEFSTRLMKTAMRFMKIGHGAYLCIVCHR